MRSKGFAGFGQRSTHSAQCVQFHIPEARKAGLNDMQIAQALRLADKVRRVPARRVLDVAFDMLDMTSATAGAVSPDSGEPAAGAEALQCCR